MSIVNPLTPVLPNLYVTVIGWEHSPKEIYIERNISSPTNISSSGCPNIKFWLPKKYHSHFLEWIMFLCCTRVSVDKGVLWPKDFQQCSCLYSERGAVRTIWYTAVPFYPIDWSSDAFVFVFVFVSVFVSVFVFVWWGGFCVQSGTLWSHPILSRRIDCSSEG